MRKLFAIVALLACAGAVAQAAPVPFPVGANITLTWTAPTANSDGSTPAQIGGYNVYVTNTDTALTALGPETKAGPTMIAVGNVLTYTFKAVAAGTYFYAVRTWNCAVQPCALSDQSGHVSAIVAGAMKPGAPASFQISVQLTAPPK